MKQKLFDVFYDAIIEAVSVVSQCASKKNTRPILQSVNLSIAKGDKTLKVTATDSAIALTSSVPVMPAVDAVGLNVSVYPEALTQALALAVNLAGGYSSTAGLIVSFYFDDAENRLYAKTVSEQEINLIGGAYPLDLKYFNETAIKCDKHIGLSKKVLASMLNALKKSGDEVIVLDLRADNNPMKPIHAHIQDGSDKSVEFIISTCRIVD